MAREVWSKIASWWNLKEKRVNLVDEALDWIEGQGVNPKEKKILFVVGAATLALLWLNRNEATFLNKRRLANELLAHIQRDSFLWIDSRASKISIDRSRWLVSPRLACNM